MLSASLEFRNKISQNTKVMVKATLKFRDESEMELTGDDIIMEGMSFTEATSNNSTFEVGAAVIGKLNVTLNNFDGRFDECDFTGATITPYVGMDMGGDRVEWIRKGFYHVEQPDAYGATIGLECLDNLSLLDRPYSDVKIPYPASALVIVSEIADHCGVQLATSTFNNNDIQFDTEPEDENLTCRQMLSYVCNATCNYAKCDYRGQLLISWYNKGAFGKEQSLDGKWFDSASPYASGDTADGGDFLNYGSGDSYDGGILDVNFSYDIVSTMTTQTIGLDDVVITGLRVVSAENPDTEADDEHKVETAQFGADGYVIEISGNPLITYGRATEFAQKIGPLIVDMRFRIYNIQAIGTPLNEAGDAVLLIDAMQHQFRSFITQLTYKPGAYESYSCSGETPARHSASTYGPLSQAIVDFHNQIEKEKTSREKAQEDLAKRLEESSGLYKTEVVQDDGSTVYYMHDKPTLEGSKIVWKITAEAIGISSDGGQTYPYGIDIDGNTILNRIYAIGIDADYLTSGRISAQNGDNFWDLETGELRMAFDGITDSTGESLQSVIDSLKAADDENFRELQDIVSDGIITDSEKAAIDVMLKRIEAEQIEALNLYNTIYGNSNLTGVPKTNLYNAKVNLYGTNGVSGSYGNLVSAIQGVKSASDASSVSAAMSTYESRYMTYQNHRNVFTQRLTEAQQAIETAVADEKAKHAFDYVKQKEVFDRLTNNGAIQGLYMENGFLYINAEYIKTGIITDNKGYNSWNLDTGEFRLSSNNIQIGSQSLSDYIDSKIPDYEDSFKNASPRDVLNKLTDMGRYKGIFMSGDNLYINATYIATGILSSVNGTCTWDLETGLFQTHYSGNALGQYHDLYIKIDQYRLDFIMDVTVMGRLWMSPTSSDANHNVFSINSDTELLLGCPGSLCVSFQKAAGGGTYFTTVSTAALSFVSKIDYTGEFVVDKRNYSFHFTTLNFTHGMLTNWYENTGVYPIYSV